jgi:hypothetical protein
MSRLAGWYLPEDGTVVPYWFDGNREETVAERLGVLIEADERDVIQRMTHALTGKSRTHRKLVGLRLLVERLHNHG